MFRDDLWRLWAEPRVPDPPPRVRRDWALLAAGLAGTGLEAVLRDDIVWWPVSVLVTVGLCLATLWRRTHPLAMVAAAFGAGIALTLIDAAAAHPEPVGLYTGMIILVLVYALFRWGSGRHIVLGAAVAFAAFALSMLVDDVPPGDYVGSFGFLALPGVLGASVRLWSAARGGELERMRFREREALARDLHDTVAHHVSAIVVRAQAGRVLIGADPATALTTLEDVEEEGARTLEAMRGMVSALRDGNTRAELAPVAGVADLAALTRDPAGRLPIELRLDGPLDRLPLAVDGAVYRIVQESVTNARRHAARASTVRVQVTAEPGRVRVTVRDDGVATRRSRNGYGLTGLQERVTLLGGSLEAGPLPGRGWLVEARLPLGSG
ncbi:sensor histidine kinase [Dactylosporangium siamense]|uniref:histidine kinase n=1 Tax=Dactylosporangium siamense TaxID=685454 RepID=A0A919PVC0_9ACTN|nr:histidine kinase [Dactylosporangium siamense]GIG49113.1 two-component sensor histidine kinase [Dactylosporangium siamense]